MAASDIPCPGRLDRRTLHRACDRLAAREPVFARALVAHGYPPLWPRPPGFATLVKIILEQQVSLASARSVYERLEALTGGVSSASILRLGPQALRDAGLTRQKARYCHELAVRVADGRTSFARIARAADDEARGMLLEITGIGEWSANVYLLFVARRPDIWPPGDVALMRSVAELFGLAGVPANAECVSLADCWRPWRSAAARILWHSYLSRRGRHFGGGAGVNRRKRP